MHETNRERDTQSPPWCPPLGRALTGARPHEATPARTAVEGSLLPEPLLTIALALDSQAAERIAEYRCMQIQESVRDPRAAPENLTHSARISTTATECGFSSIARSFA